MRLILALGLATGVLVSLPLWLSVRGFPLMPRMPVVPPPPPPLDSAAVAVLLLLALAIMVRPQPRVEILGLSLVTALLVLADQNRCQPWVYQYVAMLVVAGPSVRGEPPGGTATRLDALRVMLASIYVWSGIQKINLLFFNDIALWLVEPIADHLPSSVRPLVEASGYAFPAAEIFVGVGLLVSRLQRPALVLGLAMHLFILYAIGPLGHDVNRTVWPWNAVMMSLLWILFGAPARLDVRSLWSSRPVLLRRLAIIAFAVLPAFNFVGLWDAYLSWGLYNNLALEADVYIAPRALPCLPDDVRRHVTRANDRNVLHVWDWAMDVLGAPPYPERWVYRRIRDQLCVCDPGGDLILFELWDPSRWRLPITPEDHRCGEAW